MADTLTTVVTTAIQHTSTITEISHALTGMGWVCLFLGWLYYWLKKLDEIRIANSEKSVSEYVKIYFKDNWIEIPSSALACLVLAIFSTEVPASLLDMRGIVSLFMVGYASSSILNTAITRAKPLLTKDS